MLYSPAFLRMYRKISASQRDSVDSAIELFQLDPFHPQLRNHLLKGSMNGIRSISGGYDLRMLYEEKDGHVLVTFIRVGKHEEVY